MILEPGPSPATRFGTVAHDFDRHALTNGFVAFLFAVTGPLAILLTVATSGGLSGPEINSWIFASYGIAGGMSILFSFRYRQPIALAWTIPGAVLLTPAFGHLSYNEIVGAYLATGLLITVLGLSGLVDRLMAAIPLPIVMGMVAGVFLPLGLGIVTGFGPAPWVAGATVGGFIAVSLFPPVARLVPPVLGAMLAGIAAILIEGQASFDLTVDTILVQPRIWTPELSPAALVELVIPLTLTVIGIQNVQGFTVLRAAGYTPPGNALTLACGLGTLVYGVLGSVPACITGPSNAILNSSGDRGKRYVGGLIFGLLMLAFGVFSPFFTQLALALPSAFIVVLGGLAMLKVLETSFATAFGGGCRLGALVAFIVTVADQPLFNIGAAFWGLIAGLVTSWVLERGEWPRAASS